MARAAKSVNNIQVFRGSLPTPDVFAANPGIGCCGPGDYTYDKLGERVRFDNGLKHLSPNGGIERYRFPAGDGFSNHKADIIRHINAVGVGATISVIAIPTYAFLHSLGVHIAASEPGLTFDLITRNGLVIPDTTPIQVVATVDEDSPCGITRTQTNSDFAAFGALADGELFIDLFARHPDGGTFSLEADEIILRVAAMPTDPVVGLFDLTISAGYDVIYRAEQ
jgi:hypothetical protein